MKTAASAPPRASRRVTRGWKRAVSDEDEADVIAARPSGAITASPTLRPVASGHPVPAKLAHAPVGGSPAQPVVGGKGNHAEHAADGSWPLAVTAGSNPAGGGGGSHPAGGSAVQPPSTATLSAAAATPATAATAVTSMRSRTHGLRSSNSHPSSSIGGGISVSSSGGGSITAARTKAVHGEEASAMASHAHSPAPMTVSSATALGGALSSSSSSTTAASSSAATASASLASTLNCSSVQFINELLDILDEGPAELVAWSSVGSSFVVNDPDRFSRTILEYRFKSNNFASFVRQLNFYGFRKVNKSRSHDPSGRIWEFAHSHFVRGRPDLIAQIRRKTAQDYTTKSELETLRAELEGMRSAQWKLVDALQKTVNTYAKVVNQLPPSDRRLLDLNTLEALGIDVSALSSGGEMSMSGMRSSSTRTPMSSGGGGGALGVHSGSKRARRHMSFGGVDEYAMDASTVSAASLYSRHSDVLVEPPSRTRSASFAAGATTRSRLAGVTAATTAAAHTLSPLPSVTASGSMQVDVEDDDEDAHTATSASDDEFDRADSGSESGDACAGTATKGDAAAMRASRAHAHASGELTDADSNTAERDSVCRASPLTAMQCSVGGAPRADDAQRLAERAVAPHGAAAAAAAPDASSRAAPATIVVEPSGCVYLPSLALRLDPAMVRSIRDAANRQASGGGGGGSSSGSSSEGGACATSLLTPTAHAVAMLTPSDAPEARGGARMKHRRMLKLPAAASHGERAADNTLLKLRTADEAPTPSAWDSKSASFSWHTHAGSLSREHTLADDVQMPQFDWSILLQPQLSFSSTAGDAAASSLPTPDTADTSMTLRSSASLSNFDAAGAQDSWNVGMDGGLPPVRSVPPSDAAADVDDGPSGMSATTTAGATSVAATESLRSRMDKAQFTFAPSFFGVDGASSVDSGLPLPLPLPTPRNSDMALGSGVFDASALSAASPSERATLLPEREMSVATGMRIPLAQPLPLDATTDGGVQLISMRAPAGITRSASYASWDARIATDFCEADGGSFPPSGPPSFMRRAPFDMSIAFSDSPRMMDLPSVPSGGALAASQPMRSHSLSTQSEGDGQPPRSVSCSSSATMSSAFDGITPGLSQLQVTARSTFGSPQRGYGAHVPVSPSPLARDVSMELTSPTSAPASPSGMRTSARAAASDGTDDTVHGSMYSMRSDAARSGALFSEADAWLAPPSPLQARTSASAASPLATAAHVPSPAATMIGSGSLALRRQASWNRVQLDAPVRNAQFAAYGTPLVSGGSSTPSAGATVMGTNTAPPCGISPSALSAPQLVGFLRDELMRTSSAVTPDLSAAANGALRAASGGSSSSSSSSSTLAPSLARTVYEELMHQPSVPAQLQELMPGFPTTAALNNGSAGSGLDANAAAAHALQRLLDECAPDRVLSLLLPLPTVRQLLMSLGGAVASACAALLPMLLRSQLAVIPHASY